MNKKWQYMFFICLVLLVGIGLSYFPTLNSLRITKNELTATQNDLLNTKTLLNTTQTQLSTTKTQLSDKESDLRTVTTQLNDTKTELTNVKTQYNNTKNELANVTTQLQTKSSEISQMSNTYTSLRNKINTRLGDTIKDERSFITPNDAIITTKVQEITGGYSENVNEYWQDFKSLYDWVIKNIEYSYDSYTPELQVTLSDNFKWQADFWRTPTETIKDKTGDCEDQALLLASMLKNYNQGKYGIWLIRIITKIPEPSAHLAVAFPVTGGKLTILDPAGTYYTGYQNGYLTAENNSQAISNWLLHWTREMPGAIVDGVFSESIDASFTSNEEFIIWLNKQ